MFTSGRRPTGGLGLGLGATLQVGFVILTAANTKHMHIHKCIYNIHRDLRVAVMSIDGGDGSSELPLETEKRGNPHGGYSFLQQGHP